MLEHLGNPEYLHVLLNPLPVYGLAVGLVSLIFALCAWSRSTRVIALAIVFVCAISAAPVYHYGKAAKDRVVAMSDTDGGKWIEEHERRAEELIYLFYGVAALSAATLAAERLAPRAALPLAIVTALLTLATLGAGGYIASAGGRIRHREFRYVPPPENAERERD